MNRVACSKNPVFLTTLGKDGYILDGSLNVAIMIFTIISRLPQIGYFEIKTHPHVTVGCPWLLGTKFRLTLVYFVLTL